MRNYNAVWYWFSKTLEVIRQRQKALPNCSQKAYHDIIKESILYMRGSGLSFSQVAFKKATPPGPALSFVKWAFIFHFGAWV